MIEANAIEVYLVIWAIMFLPDLLVKIVHSSLFLNNVQSLFCM